MGNNGKKINRAEVERFLQSMETKLDSISQKLANEEHPEARRINQVLTLVRTLQKRYFPVRNYSLKNYGKDAEFFEDGRPKPHPSRWNYPKWRKENPPKKQKKLVRLEGDAATH